MQMKRNLLILAGALSLISLWGCATAMLSEQAAHQAAPPTVEICSFDVSSPGSDVATLIVQFRQPSYQVFAEKYAVKIDAKAPLVVSKQSDVTIKLNAGSHSLKFYVTSSNPADSENVTFGESTKKDVVTTKNQELKFKYVGPIRLTGSGNLEELK
jgi:hypothetical protein